MGVCTLTSRRLIVHFCPQLKPELSAYKRKERGREREREMSSIAVLVTKSMASFPEDVYQYISAPTSKPEITLMFLYCFCLCI